jgi:hypothetical protein
VDDFEYLVAELGPRLAAAEQARRVRPGRRRAPGAGRPFKLPLKDRVLLSLIWVRFCPPDYLLSYHFGVSNITAWRTVRQCLSALADSPHALLAVEASHADDAEGFAALVQAIPQIKHSLDLLRRPAKRSGFHRRFVAGLKNLPPEAAASAVGLAGSCEVCAVAVGAGKMKEMIGVFWRGETARVRARLSRRPEVRKEA